MYNTGQERSARCMRKRREVMERVGWRRNRLTAREINRQIDRWKGL